MSDPYVPDDDPEVTNPQSDETLVQDVEEDEDADTDSAERRDQIP
jgi:hypothetical protein